MTAGWMGDACGACLGPCLPHTQLTISYSGGGGRAAATTVAVVTSDETGGISGSSHASCVPPERFLCWSGVPMEQGLVINFLRHGQAAHNINAEGMRSAGCSFEAFIQDA